MRKHRSRDVVALALFSTLGVQASSATAAGSVSVAITTTLDRHPVSALVYGASFATDRLQQVKYPGNRWGGNGTSRYSWTMNASNSGSDWFFIGTPSDTAAGATLPDGSSSDVFVQNTLATGSVPFITVPMIGWTAKSRSKVWGFSIAKYGAQQSNECSANGNFSGCSSDAGNGILSNGTNVTGNDPSDTSAVSTPSSVTGWMAHLESKFGAASSGGVRYYMLDNEPTLWNSTHRDVHPGAVGYDELWSRTNTYATAIKGMDAAAQTMGPSAWGWCAYFYSGLDSSGCGPGSDQAAHGNVPLIAWYLQNNCSAGASTGTRPVDVLDIHYYPQSTDIAFSNTETEPTASLRLRSLKSLYDPSYVDESWISTAISLVPRMKQLIQTNCPGMKLSISEYNWGGDTGITSALAQAEALAIFGREGVDIAHRWVAPAAGTKVEDAFRLYLDYDGAGSRVTGDSVRAQSADVNSVGSYAIVGSNRLYVLLFNKQTSDAVVNVSVAGTTVSGNAAAFGFDATHALGSLGTVAVAAGAAHPTVPARSAMLLVLPLAPSAPVPSGVPPWMLGLLLLGAGTAVAVARPRRVGFRDR